MSVNFSTPEGKNKTVAVWHSSAQTVVSGADVQKP